MWTDELTAALQEFQIALGVEPTGVVDAATLAAFEQALAESLDARRHDRTACAGHDAAEPAPSTPGNDSAA